VRVLQEADELSEHSACRVGGSARFVKHRQSTGSPRDPDGQFLAIAFENALHFASKPIITRDSSSLDERFRRRLIVELVAQRASSPSTTRRSRLIAVVVVVVAAIVFLVDAAPRIAAPFGNSHDGMNGAMWASGAEAITDQGPIESRLGAEGSGREVYAHHPPAIFLLTGLARAIGGHDEAALRAPAWLASLATIVLTWLLLRRLGASLAAATCGIAALVGSQMFLLYGAMLNFEAIALPIAIATLLVVVEPRPGHACRPTAACALGLAGALVSWEGALLGVAVAAWGEWRRATAPTQSHRTSRWLAVGTALGTVFSVVWLVWANRGIDAMWSALRMRTDTTAATLGEQAEMQLTYLRLNFSPWWLTIAAIGVAAVILEPSLRRLSHLLIVAVPTMFMLALPGGAYFHAYWNYWIVLTVAVYVAAGIDRLSGASHARRVAFASVGLLLLAVAPHVDQSPVRRQFEQGALGADLIRDRTPPGEAVLVWPTLQEPDYWVTYYTDQPVEQMRTEGIAGLAERHPDREVLVWAVAVDHYQGPQLFDALRAVAEEQRGDYLAVRADRLAAVLASG
jgi:hypothetical protein